MLVLVQINSRMFKIILGFVLLFSGLILNAQDNGSKLEGSIQIDSVWRPIVYLSHIESFNELNTISSDMIIAEARIDENGYFSFPLSFLPEEDRFYRLHISKNNAPAASLIIGGADENHMFLILSKNVKVNIKSNTNKSLFREVEITGDAVNKSIQNINRIISYKDSTNFGDSKVKREYITKEINEKLRMIADSSSHSLVSLYALYRSDFRTNYSVNKAFYKNYFNKRENNSSTYFRDFYNLIPKEKDSHNPFFIIGVLLILVVMYLMYVKSSKHKVNKKIRSLTVQERKIFTLLQQGKSNKEISEVCNIELSTVKTHVSNIYSKLNIKSRKEALEI